MILTYPAAVPIANSSSFEDGRMFDQDNAFICPSFSPFTYLSSMMLVTDISLVSHIRTELS